MRTTVDIPNDLYALVAAISKETHRTLSQTVANLIRRGLGQGQGANVITSARTGLPVVHLGRMITTEDVRALDA